MKPLYPSRKATSHCRKGEDDISDERKSREKAKMTRSGGKKEL